jgi:hypothetical protein
LVFIGKEYMMASAFLEPLIPCPIDITETMFSGKLLIDGNLNANKIIFSFKFSDPLQVSPLLIRIKVAKKTYDFFIEYRDLNNPIMRTDVLYPDFSMRNRIQIIRIEPIVSYRR